MNTYTIKVTDQDTGAPLTATITYLDGSGQAVLVNGAPASASTDATGSLTFTAAAASLQVRTQAAGYVSEDATLQPGTNNIGLGAVQGPTATITAARTPQQNSALKAIVALVVLAAALYLLYKYKIIAA